MCRPPQPSDIGASSAHLDERWLEVEPGVDLRVLCWVPTTVPHAAPILFVAGWVSEVQGWTSLLEALVSRQPVFYVETREKRSARISPAKMEIESFKIQRLADDLKVICTKLDLDCEQLLLFGSSMGSNAILEALKRSELGCRAAFVIGPNSEFRAPWWGRLLTRMPASWYPLAKYLVLWYLRNLRVNTNEDPAQMARYEKTLRAADATRLKLSARAVLDYRIWNDLGTITAPVAIGLAAGDTLHSEEPIREMAKVIPRGQVVECPSSTYMHTDAVLADIDRFLAELRPG